MVEGVRISILVPVYNVADKIERCAVSLFEQTHCEMEYVFADDCSTDGSLAVLQAVMERYPERRSQVRIVRHERNTGVAGTRNTALANATGERLMWVDSDDFIPLDACERLLRAMEETGADIVSGAYVTMLRDGSTRTTLPSHLSRERLLRRRLCMGYEPSSLWARLYRKELFVREMWAREGVNLSEDYMMTNRIFLHARLATIDEVVYNYDFTAVRDMARLYPGHIGQLTQSVEEVDRYYHADDEGRRFLGCIQLAYLFIIRMAVEYGLEAKEAEGRLMWWARPIAWLLKHKPTFGLGNLVYKAVRAGMLF